jgi:hypothetical protein
VAIGHSGLTGAASDPGRTADAPENSWATGSTLSVAGHAEMAAMVYDYLYG